MRKLLGKIILWAIEPELKRRNAVALTGALTALTGSMNRKRGESFPRFTGVGGESRH